MAFLISKWLSANYKLHSRARQHVNGTKHSNMMYYSTSQPPILEIMIYFSNHFNKSFITIIYKQNTISFSGGGLISCTSAGRDRIRRDHTLTKSQIY